MVTAGVIDMAINKIKIRNLDEEVFGYFYKTGDKIGYDQLDETVITEIKNNGTTTGYNDTELRNRIINIENSMVSKTTADSLYAAKTDYDTSEVVDSKIEKAKQDIHMEFDNYKNDFIPMQDGIITENLLSYELKAKVNYYGPSSGGGSEEEIPSSDIAELNIKIDKNTYDINSIKNTLNTNVYLKENPITINDLEDNVRLLINNSRQNSDLITIDDLDQALKNKINSGSAASIAANEVIDAMYQNSESGQVLIASKEDGTETYSVTPKYIFATDVFIFKMDEQYLDNEIVFESPDDPEENRTFDSAKTYAQNNGYKYIADLRREILLEYDGNTATWIEHNSPEEVYSKLSGSFVISYPDDIVSYCKKLRDTIEVFNPNEFVKEQEIENIIEYFDDLDGRLTAIEENTTINTAIEQINTKLTALEENMVTANDIEEINTQLEELTNRIVAIEEQLKNSGSETDPTT